jgi:hypothetical protein
MSIKGAQQFMISALISLKRTREKYVRSLC